MRIRSLGRASVVGALCAVSVFFACQHAQGPVEPACAGLEYDWDNSCQDLSTPNGTPTPTFSTGGVDDCQTWWTYEYDYCSAGGEACEEEEGHDPENHYAWIDPDESTWGCSIVTCAQFNNRYQIDADIWFCPYVPTDPTATPSGPTPTPFTGAKVGEVTLYKGASETTADLVMLDTYQHARASWECNDLLTWIPDEVKFEWGDICNDCTTLAKGAAPVKMSVTVRCCTSGDP